MIGGRPPLRLGKRRVTSVCGRGARKREVAVLTVPQGSTIAQSQLTTHLRTMLDGETESARRVGDRVKGSC